MSYIAFRSEAQAVVQYSVKTCHPYFYNQLYHGVDEYGLAGSWLSDALNTNIHTFEVAPSSPSSTVSSPTSGSCSEGLQIRSTR